LRRFTYIDFRTLLTHSLVQRPTAEQLEKSKLKDEAKQIKIVPAICTQCSAQIEVDSSRDAAICPHCGTAFIVEKAVDNYNIQAIQSARVEHIDTVNINNTTQGNAGTALHFIDKHLDRRTMMKIEKEKLKAEKQKREAEESARRAKYIPLVVIAYIIFMLALVWMTTRH